MPARTLSRGLRGQKGPRGVDVGWRGRQLMRLHALPREPVCLVLLLLATPRGQGRQVAELLVTGAARALSRAELSVAMAAPIAAPPRPPAMMAQSAPALKGP